MPAPARSARIAALSAGLPPVVLSGVSMVIAVNSLNVTPTLPQRVFASANLRAQLVPVGARSAGPVLRKTGCKSKLRNVPGFAQVPGAGAAEKSLLMVTRRLGSRAVVE